MVLRQRQPLWLRVFIAIFTVFFLIVLGTIILDGDPRHLICAVPTVVLVCLGVGVLVWPPRIELREDALVARTIRRVRVPYEDIVAVRGDVPARLDWSTHLVVERRGGAPVKLPVVERPVPEVYDMIIARCPPATPASPGAT